MPPVCAEEVRLGEHLVSNLKAVLQEAIRELTIPHGAHGPTEIRLKERFFDLTIALEPLETALSVACEFHFTATPAPLVIAAFARDGSVRLRLPADCFPAGACTVVLRDEDSQREIGQRQLLIAKPV